MAKEELPPRIPEQLAELDQAVALLGNRAQQEKLKSEAAARLVALIGEYPISKKLAARWKAALKGLARDIREMGDTAPQPKRAPRHKIIVEMPPPPRRTKR